MQSGGQCKVYRVVVAYGGEPFAQMLATKPGDLVYYGWQYQSWLASSNSQSSEQVSTATDGGWAWGALIERTGVVRPTWGLFHVGCCAPVPADEYAHDEQGSYLRVASKSCAAETIVTATAGIGHRWFIAEEQQSRSADPHATAVLFDRPWTGDWWRRPPLDVDDVSGYDDDDRRTAAADAAPELALDWVSYGHFIRCAAALSRALRGRVGVAPRSAVAICAQTRLEWALADVACLFSSYVSVPLYPTAAVDTQRYIMQQADVKLVVCDAQQLPAMRQAADTGTVRFVVMGDRPTDSDAPGSDCHYLHELVAAQLAASDQLPDWLHTDGDALATIMYTSGSTGLPKGAVMTERRWHAHVAKAYVLSYPLHLIGYAQLAHIMERQHIYLAMLAGGRYLLYRRSPADVLDVMRRYRPTQLSAVPGFWQQLHSGYLADRARTASDARQLYRKWRRTLGGRLQYIVVGGALPSDELLHWLRRCFKCQVFNGYGATETGGIAQDDVILPGVDVRLEDAPELGYSAADRPYPRGQIVVRTANMIAGYYKNDAANAELFTADGYWRSGDIGVLLPNRTIRIIDRVKNIFKLAQGEYVAPEPLEQLYCQSALVRQCFVYGDIDRAYLVAVVVPAADRLRAALAVAVDDDAQLAQLPQARALLQLELQRLAHQAHLPGHELPRALHVEPVPFSAADGLLTPSGKCRRAALAQHYRHVLQALYQSTEQQQDFGSLVIQLIDRCLSQSSHQSFDQLSHQSFDQLSNQSFDQLSHQSFDQLSHQSFDQLSNQSFDQSLHSDLIGQLSGQLELFVRGAVDSLSAISLLVRLRSRFPAADLSLEALYRYSAEQLLAVLAGCNTDAMQPATCEQLLADWRASDYAADSVVEVEPARCERSAVLLTGATGQIGTQLLYHLLVQRPDVHCWCLVRAPSADAALQRLLSALRQRTDVFERLSRDAVVQRLTAVAAAGDSQLAELLGSGSVGVVYHVAAHVSWSRPYALLRQANVELTRALAQLCSGNNVRLVFVSTAGVAPVHAVDAAGTRDADALAGDIGYLQSKAVAERFVRQAAAQRALQCVVVRPAMVTGHSQLGVCQASDFVPCYLRGVVELGCYLHDDAHWQDMLPVDVAALQLLRIGDALASGRLASGDTFALVDPLPVTFADVGSAVCAWCRQQQPPRPPPQPVDYRAFRAAVQQSPGSPLTPFLQTVFLPDGMRAAQQPIAAPSTVHRLAAIDIDCSTSTVTKDQLIARYLTFLFSS